MLNRVRNSQEWWSLPPVVHHRNDNICVLVSLEHAKGVLGNYLQMCPEGCCCHIAKNDSRVWGGPPVSLGPQESTSPGSRQGRGVSCRPWPALPVPNPTPAVRSQLPCSVQPGDGASRFCSALQRAVPAAEPAHGRPAGLHLRGTAGPRACRCLDGPGHPVRVVQPATGRHQVLH